MTTEDLAEKIEATASELNKVLLVLKQDEYSIEVRSGMRKRKTRMHSRRMRTVQCNNGHLGGGGGVSARGALLGAGCLPDTPWTE